MELSHCICTMENDLSQFGGGAVVRQSILKTGDLGTSDSWVDRYIQWRRHSDWDKIAFQAVVWTRDLQTSTCLWLHRKESTTPPSNSPLLLIWQICLWLLEGGQCYYTDIQQVEASFQVPVHLKILCIQLFSDNFWKVTDFTARKLDFEVWKHVYKEESRKN